MDNYLKVALDNNITIAYYWLNEGAAQMSWSICDLLQQLVEDLEDKEFIQRIEDLENDIDVFAKAESLEFTKDHIVIPDDFDYTFEVRLLWITQQSILNLFNLGNYELGFMMLMDITEEWHLLYEMIIPNIQKSSLNKPLLDWIAQHVMFGVDLFGEEFLTRINQLNLKSKEVLNN